VLGQCGIGRTHEEFLQRIDEALQQPGPQLSRSERMKTESWSARLNDIRCHLASIS